MSDALTASFGDCLSSAEIEGVLKACDGDEERATIILNEKKLEHKLLSKAGGKGVGKMGALRNPHLKVAGRAPSLKRTEIAAVLEHHAAAAKASPRRRRSLANPIDIGDALAATSISDDARVRDAVPEGKGGEEDEGSAEELDHDKRAGSSTRSPHK